jgi:hypothetical protein
MATWDDVRRIALALPEAVEPQSRDGLAQWRVRNKLFAWERPLRRSDIQALGRRVPEGPILAARCATPWGQRGVAGHQPGCVFHDTALRWFTQLSEEATSHA